MIEKKEFGSEYYDEAFITRPAYSLLVDADHSAHSDLYSFVIKLINNNDRILELGCGTGQFAEKIIKNGFHYILGIDFSIEGIKLCKKRCPFSSFICKDLYEEDFSNIDYTTALSLETMEHMTNDIVVLSKIENGKRVIISVPSFDDAAHVRWFNSPEDVGRHYGDVFTEIKIYTVNRYFVIEAIK